ncbi:MAG TPA: glycogen-binding domain-containing protein [Tepidisphaeraceae bacterium]|nr:glycogen-binding domain-containing protein [Tepidisphaeraceae bacterium]
MINVLPTGQIEFRFFRRNVSDVCIVGGFNGWRVGASPLVDEGDGWWRTVLNVPDGVHQFRYVADGQWFTDFAAHGVEHSKWGLNSLLIVGPVAIAA